MVRLLLVVIFLFNSSFAWAGTAPVSPDLNGIFVRECPTCNTKGTVDEFTSVRNKGGIQIRIDKKTIKCRRCDGQGYLYTHMKNLKEFKPDLE